MRLRLRRATRQAILQAAASVFAELGIHGARMEGIASRAGVAVGTLYNYFRDREALLDALLEDCRQRAGESIDQALGVEGPFEERLRAFLGGLLRLFATNFWLFSLLAEQPAAGEGQQRRLFEEIYRGAERLTATGLREGALRSDDAALFPAMVMGVLRAAFFRRLYLEDLELEEMVEPLARFFLSGAGSLR